MTAVYILAVLLVIAAGFFALPRLPNPVKVIPHRPEPQPGGGILWKVDFQLLFRSRAGGYVVQHIRIREMMTVCDDPQFAQPFPNTPSEFWEAWPIQAGTRIPHDRLGPVAIADFDDAFRFGFSINDFGISRSGRVRLEVRATVRFYEGVTLPNTFRTNNPATKAGHALSDINRPPFWRSGGTQHNLTYEWDNCGPGGEPRETIDEYPKRFF